VFTRATLAILDLKRAHSILGNCAILRLSFPQRNGGARMRWSSEDKLGCAVVCILGAMVGLFVGFIVFAVSVARGTGEVFAHWIARPSLYWPWPTFGVAISVLGFCAVRILRAPRQSSDDKFDAKSRADAYYALISKAVSRLPINDGKARQNVYDRARKALSDHSPEGELPRELVALEAAIKKVERRAPPERVNLRSPLNRPSTTLLVISLFFPGLWMLDVTCMSLYWVARIPRN